MIPFFTRHCLDKRSGMPVLIEATTLPNSPLVSITVTCEQCQGVIAHRVFDASDVNHERIAAEAGALDNAAYMLNPHQCPRNKNKKKG